MSFCFVDISIPLVFIYIHHVGLFIYLFIFLKLRKPLTAAALVSGVACGQTETNGGFARHKSLTDDRELNFLWPVSRVGTLFFGAAFQICNH